MSHVLVVNSGSSSLKYQLVDPATGDWSAKGLVERIGESGSRLRQECTGRDDLVEALRARCEARGLAVECRPSDATEVTIVCDNAVIETRLGEWAAKLRAATEA